MQTVGPMGRDIFHFYMALAAVCLHFYFVGITAVFFYVFLVVAIAVWEIVDVIRSRRQ